ncbi:hypothetical protein KIH74_17395 [Kineosporia sp. J2-2]|uniref:Uncharacterized protein n=1 Tax=Kineosporia corallincola TaxID=2835133 RepID=A0ABS5TIM7_9ACTN|nr:hypothetical protein [Kineosporia corallincola]MBT0770723.1 hypothetical protein [Kineosporia corallincola]
MLFISHNLAVARYVSDSVHVVRQGRVAGSGPADAVPGHPQDPYTVELPASVPVLGEKPHLEEI